MNPQLETLLKIQSVEYEIIELEGKKKKLPIRKQISELVTEVNSIQELYQRTETAVLKMEQSYAEVKKAYSQCAKKLESVTKQLEELSDDAAPEKINELLSAVASIKTTAEKKYSELSKMLQQLDKANKMAIEIGKKINQRRQMYDQLKPDFDKQVAEIDGVINEKKTEIEGIEKNVDESLLKRYKSARAKLNRPPLYEMTGTSCRACNMSMTDAAKKKVEKEIFHECENCGALLYVKEN